jgi:glycosyltransferase involved in cell wall biosynthesis
VIVTDRGGAHESVLAGETGLIVPADDPIALADAVVALAADSGLRRRLGRRGRQHAAQRSGWSEVFGQLVASYDDVAHHPSWSHRPPDTAALAPAPPR